MTPEQINLKAVIACKNWYFNLNDKRLASEFMTDFALSIADELQREAWNAAREIKSYHMVDDEEYSVPSKTLEYDSFEQWKEKQQ